MTTAQIPPHKHLSGHVATPRGQCGVYLGAGAEYAHYTSNNNDLMVPLRVGYSFFINRHLTIEPELYYKMSTHDFGNNSQVGVSIGLGFYF